jgi:uncharacterized protein (TIGR02271 family)
MANERYILDNDGHRGTIESLNDQQVMIRLGDERLIVLPRSTLIEQDDGHFRVAFSLSRFQKEGVMAFPVVEETLSIDKREVERMVRITKTAQSEEIVVDEPLLRENVDVERITVNRYVDEPLPVRHEGEKTIIPLVEEVLVVEKRLLLREEIHISRRQTTERYPQSFVLRREDIQVERSDEPHES